VFAIVGVKTAIFISLLSSSYLVVGCMLVDNIAAEGNIVEVDTSSLVVISSCQ
jgi:hypothetical protein